MRRSSIVICLLIAALVGLCAAARAEGDVHQYEGDTLGGPGLPTEFRIQVDRPGKPSYPVYGIFMEGGESYEFSGTFYVRSRRFVGRVSRHAGWTVDCTFSSPTRATLEVRRPGFKFYGVDIRKTSGPDGWPGAERVVSTPTPTPTQDFSDVVGTWSANHDGIVYIIRPNHTCHARSNTRDMGEGTWEAGGSSGERKVYMNFPHPATEDAYGHDRTLVLRNGKMYDQWNTEFTR